MFAALLKERAPPGIDVYPEHILTTEPQKADLLLLRRASTTRQEGEAGVLRGLWPRLSQDTLVEFKSVSHAFRRGDWLRLVGYGAQYQTTQVSAPSAARLHKATDLTLVLVVASVTPTLLAEADDMGWAIEDLGSGYRGVRGCMYPSFVASLDEVADAERDDLLGAFGHRTMQDPTSRRWFRDHLARRTEEDVMTQDLEGYDEVMEKLVESLPPERRLAGIPPESRRAGLTPAETVLVMPDEMLRQLPASFIEKLPADVQAAIRKRLSH